MNNLLLDSSQDKRETVEQVVERHRRSKEFYAEQFKLMRDMYDIYRCLSKASSEDDDDPNYCQPYAYSVVEGAVAQIALPGLSPSSILTKPKQNTKEFRAKAQNFGDWCRAFFGTSSYRLAYIASERERAIAGTRWEFGEWVDEWSDGKVWKNVSQISVVSKIVGALKSMAHLQVPFVGPKEVPHKHPERIGYQVRFPSVFNVYPQPGITRVEDMDWLIEEEDRITLDSLRKAQYTNDKGEKVPVYDLSEIDEFIKGRKDLQPEYPNDKAEVSQPQTQRNKDKNNTEEDVNSVSLLRMHTPTGRVTVANGKWLIQAVDDLWHKPGIKARAIPYVQDKYSIYGIGILQPVKDAIAELNGIHNLSMQNWIRIINRMIFYREDAIPCPDDFLPRAGGKIRVKAGVSGSVRDAVFPLDQQDVVSSMLAMESNVKGSIERNTAVTDYSPGVDGTKQYHSTYSGLVEIQKSDTRIFSVICELDLAAKQQQMDEMYWFAEQFMFDKQAVNFTDDNGRIRAESFSRDDFDTDGAGFIFVKSEDPSFGDPSIARNQALLLFDKVMNYETFRRQFKDPDDPKLGFTAFWKDILRSFGKSDTSEYLLSSDGALDPDTEWTMMLQGLPVQVNYHENLIEHLLAHMRKRMEPDFAQGVQSGQIPAGAAAALAAHIAQTEAAIKAIVSNPMGAAQARAQDDIASQGNSEPIAQPPQSNLGQNLPAQTGAAPMPSQVQGGAI